MEGRSNAMKVAHEKTGRHNPKICRPAILDSDLSAAKWSRWEKRESLSVLLHKPLVT